MYDDDASTEKPQSGPSTLGDRGRVVLFRSGTTTGQPPDRDIVRAFKLAGFELDVRTDVPPDSESRDLVVSVGDPNRAGAVALATGVPILPVGSTEQLIDLAADIPKLTVRRHWVSQITVDRTRTRAFFCDARVESTAIAIPIELCHLGEPQRLASVRFNTDDPIRMRSPSDTRSRIAGCVAEDCDGRRMAMSLPHGTTITIRSCSPREHLSVTLDQGRFRAVANHVAVGPARSIGVADATSIPATR